MVPAVGNPLVEPANMVVCGSVAPLDPRAIVVLTVEKTFSVPLVGNPTLEATLIVPVGSVTLLEPAAMVVAAGAVAFTLMVPVGSV